MPRLNPTMYDFINSPDLYRRLDIMPSGWRKVNETTETAKSLKSKLTKVKRRIKTKIRALTKKNDATLTFDMAIIGPHRERKAFTYPDGHVLVLERAYEAWEFTMPKPIPAVPRIRPQQQSDGDKIRQRVLNPKDSVLAQGFAGLLRFDFEGGPATTNFNLRKEVLRAGETVREDPVAADDNSALLTGRPRASELFPISLPAFKMPQMKPWSLPKAWQEEAARVPLPLSHDSTPATSLSSDGSSLMSFWTADTSASSIDPESFKSFDMICTTGWCGLGQEESFS